MELRKLTPTIKLSTIATAVVISVFGAYAYTQRNIFLVGDSHASSVPPTTSTPTSTAASTTVPTLAPQGSDEPPRYPTALPNFADIAASQGLAVVNISVAGTIKTATSGLRDMPQFDSNDPFADFFRRFQPQIPRGGAPTRGQGSGFIVSADGIVLTNAHVVADADEVTVKLTDRREFKAKVIGVDKPTDVAVLRIDAKNLPAVRIGNPTTTRVGEWVVAIGSPFGFENSVTAGIVSAKSRSLPSEGYVPFLQTDVAINPGNSGGPLFNLNGEVIGINSQIYSQSGGYQGLSFAIPIDVAMKVERQLLDTGKVSRGRLGVLIQEVDQALAESFGLDKATGALVGTVERGSPAAKAGIEPGDVILKFNGRDIAHSSDLPPLVADLVPGTAANVQIWHQKQAKDVRVTVGELKAARNEARNDPAAKTSLGLAVRPLTADERKEADVSAGLLVEGATDGPAARAGIREGDVILSVNGKPVANAEQLRKLVSESGKRAALRVLREDQQLFVPINLG